MKKSTKWHLLATTIFTVCLALVLFWYDWRLFVVLIAFGWANNIQMRATALERRGL